MKLKDRLLLPENTIRAMFAVFAACCLITAVLAPDRGDMFAGLWRLSTQSGQISKSFFDPSYGGIAGSFLNCALVSLVLLGLYCLPGSRPGSSSVLAFFLTAGFCFWGMTVLNIWPSFAGVALYCLIRKRRPGELADLFPFSTGLSPLITELLFRYPGTQWHGFTLSGVLMAFVIGIFIGFLLPAVLPHGPNMHKSYTLYNAAVPIGLTAFFLRALLYQVFTSAPPVSAPVGLSQDLWALTNGFCLVVFTLAILFGLRMGGWRQYSRLLRDSGFDADFAASYSTAAALINFGVYGLFILLYYNATGAVWNGVTFGTVFCMVCCSFKGSHPLNVWPIMVGYALASLMARFVCGLTGTEFNMALDAQAIVVGVCYASGLCPVAGHYGVLAGIAFGMLHFILVTCVPLLHSYFCLYNGGLTASFVCFLFIPVLEHYFRKKHERKPSGS